MSQQSTESVLKEWRFGSTQAERLCADLLHLEGYESVDPQHPLGGPDERKDIVCLKEGRRWTGAVYFPPTEPTFKDIKGKFEHDAKGAIAINAYGMAFFVNQHLTLGERDELLTASGSLKADLPPGAHAWAAGCAEGLWNSIAVLAYRDDRRGAVGILERDELRCHSQTSGD